MEGMFEYCSSLISIPDISKWNTNKAKYKSFMFSNCCSLISLPDIFKWFTTEDKNLFDNCISLLNITGIKESKEIDKSDDDSEDSEIKHDNTKENEIDFYESDDNEKFHLAIFLKNG